MSPKTLFAVAASKQSPSLPTSWWTTVTITTTTSCAECAKWTCTLAPSLLTRGEFKKANYHGVFLKQLSSSNGDLLCEAHYQSQQLRCAECGDTIGQEEHQVTVPGHAWHTPYFEYYVYILFLLGSRSSPTQGWSVKEFIKLLTVHPSGHGKQIIMCPYFSLTCFLHPRWSLCTVANVAVFHCQVETFSCIAGARERGLCGQRGGELLHCQGTSQVQHLHAIANII